MCRNVGTYVKRIPGFHTAKIVFLASGYTVKFMSHVLNIKLINFC